MAMLRLGRRMGNGGLARLVVSVRRPEDLYYAGELRGADDVRVLYTRQSPPGEPRPAGRVAAADLVAAADATVYVCGSSPFADTVTDLLLDGGVEAGRIRVERFGPSG